jgi:hypothetical protein
MGNCLRGGHVSTDARRDSGTPYSAHGRLQHAPAARPTHRPQTSYDHAGDGRWEGLASHRPDHHPVSLSGMAARRPLPPRGWQQVTYVDQQAVGAAATAGTSTPGQLCLTYGLDLCFAVAVGGEQASDELDLPTADARIFHVQPANYRAGLEIGRYVRELQEQGYAVSAQIAGGDTASESSQARLGAVVDVLQSFGVEPVLRATDRQTGEEVRALGAGVDQHGRLQFVLV